MAKEVKKVTKKTTTKKVVKKAPSKKKKVVKKTSKDVIKTEQASIEIDESGITVKSDKPLTIIDSSLEKNNLDISKEPEKFAYVADEEVKKSLQEIEDIFGPSRYGQVIDDRKLDPISFDSKEAVALLSSLKDKRKESYERFLNKRGAGRKPIQKETMVTPFISSDTSDELYLNLAEKLKQIDSKKDLEAFYSKEYIKSLAKSASSLDEEEVAYITSYIELFKAKKNFEQLRIKVGDFKI